MIIVLSGEGKTDLGEVDYSSGVFKAGAMYMIVDKLIEQKLSYSPYEVSKENIHYIHETELKTLGKNIKVLPSKKRAIETGFFYKNARVVAQIAKQKEADIAVLFRDSDLSDKREWEIKYKAVIDGFNIEDFKKGVAMLPRPKSEAWLLCALKNNYQNCKDLENLSGNDSSPKNLKNMIDEYGFSHDEICQKIKNNELNINKIDMDSFNIFRNRVLELLS